MLVRSSFSWLDSTNLFPPYRYALPDVVSWPNGKDKPMVVKVLSGCQRLAEGHSSSGFQWFVASAFSTRVGSLVRHTSHCAGTSDWRVLFPVDFRLGNHW